MKKEEVRKIKSKMAELKLEIVLCGGQIEDLERRNSELERLSIAKNSIIIFIVIGMSILLGLSQAGIL